MPYFLRLIKIALMLIAIIIVLYFSNLLLSKRKEWFLDFNADILNYFLPGFPRKLEGAVAWLLLVSVIILLLFIINTVLS